MPGYRKSHGNPKPDTFVEYPDPSSSQLADFFRAVGILDDFPALRSVYPEKLKGTFREGSDPDGPWFLSDRIVAARRNAAKFIHSIGREKLAERIGQCSQSMILMQAERDGKRERMPLVAKCEHRLCPKCAIDRTLLRARQITEAIERERLNGCRFTHAVFTVPNCRPSELSESVKKLKRAWLRLRGGGGGKSKPIKPFNVVAGGIWNLEISHNYKSDSWHPHLHAILDSEFMTPQAARDAWSYACAAEGIFSKTWRVDLSELKGLRGIMEVAKYAVKPMKTTKLNSADRWRELIDALQNMRTCDSWGSLSLPPIKPRKSAKSDCTLIKGGCKRWLEMFHERKEANQVKEKICRNPILARIAAQHYDPRILIPLRDDVTVDKISYRDSSTRTNKRITSSCPTHSQMKLGLYQPEQSPDGKTD